MPSRLDASFVAAHAVHRSEDVEERAFRMAIGSAYCFALLHAPVRSPRGPGYVLCHSYGDEFQNLRRTERAVARALARKGFPVLRFDRRGFGDSDGVLAEATLERQLEDIVAAQRHLEEATGAPATGLVGARFGALLAGLAARDGRVDRLILLNPAVRGEQYLGQLIKQTRITQLSASAGGPLRPLRDLLEELRATGVLNVIAHPLYRELYDAVRSIDLAADIRGFRGEALILHATKGTGVPKPVEALRRAIESSGARCRVEIIREPRGVAFGQTAVAAVADPVAREYLYGPMDHRIAKAVAAWAG